MAALLDEFGIGEGDKVLDPFCGTGTTLVECLKRGTSCIGIDASPASLFVSKVKTDWQLRHERLVQAFEKVLECVAHLPNDVEAFQDDLTYAYMAGSGMLQRGWIDDGPLRDALALKHAILTVDEEKRYKNALTLALIDTVVQDAANIRFGPELYVARTKRPANVTEGFANRVLAIAFDLLDIRSKGAKATLRGGDAREIGITLRGKLRPKVQAVICSPPYPAEHDYTRNTRLELAFLEAATGRADIRAIKRKMIRSNTKGVYADDTDWNLVWAHPGIASLATKIEKAVAGRTHGFARLYSTVIASYFGGMYRHLRSLREVIVPGGKLAYVVSEQACYGDTHIRTAAILAELAEWVGFVPTEIRHWRSRRSSGTTREIAEEILILEWPRSKYRSPRPNPRIAADDRGVQDRSTARKLSAANKS